MPTEYFLMCLGDKLKYSSCLYPEANTSLEDAEEAMLRECLLQLLLAGLPDPALTAAAATGLA